MHAKTAGYLAAAELRHQLAARLGIEHGPSRRGIAPMLGVPAEVIREFSTRAREIAEATEALGVDSPSARQVAAYDTRAAKEKRLRLRRGDELVGTAHGRPRLRRVGAERPTCSDGSPGRACSASQSATCSSAGSSK